ncbi:hypothetical protein Hanom_Chr06g00564311 [Helianthus anomalus]
MKHMSYTTIRTRGFRVNSKRFYVQRLRAKLLNFFRIVARSWKSCCGSYSKSESRRRRRSNKVRDWSSPTRKAKVDVRSFGRSNSFYAEAIADCLEFIRNSLDEK